jgi:hypothetical protein
VKNFLLAYLLLMSVQVISADKGHWAKKIQGWPWTEAYEACFLINKYILCIKLTPCNSKFDSRCIHQRSRVWAGYALDGVFAVKYPGVPSGQKFCTLAFDPYQENYDTFNLKCANQSEVIRYTQLPKTLKQRFGE